MSLLDASRPQDDGWNPCSVQVSQVGPVRRQPETIRQAFDCLAKRGMCVAVGVAPMTKEVSIPIMSLVFEEKSLTGSLYGSARIRQDTYMLMELYKAGKLKLDELLTRKYPFAQINEAYDNLIKGEVARSIVTF